MVQTCKLHFSDNKTKKSNYMYTSRYSVLCSGVCITLQNLQAIDIQHKLHYFKFVDNLTALVTQYFPASLYHCSIMDTFLCDV